LMRPSIVGQTPLTHITDQLRNLTIPASEISQVTPVLAQGPTIQPCPLPGTRRCVCRHVLPGEANINTLDGGKKEPENVFSRPVTKGENKMEYSRSIAEHAVRCGAATCRSVMPVGWQQQGGLLNFSLGNFHDGVKSECEHPAGWCRRDSRAAGPGAPEIAPRGRNRADRHESLLYGEPSEVGE